MPSASHAMPCHVMPCHAMPCHAMPCHAMPCHAMPYLSISDRNNDYDRFSKVTGILPRQQTRCGTKRERSESRSERIGSARDKSGRLRSTDIATVRTKFRNRRNGLGSKVTRILPRRCGTKRERSGVDQGRGRSGLGQHGTNQVDLDRLRSLQGAPSFVTDVTVSVRK
jgi:hypothetical protein